MKIFEIVTDSTAANLPPPETPIDSLNISEVENRIDISNAVPFQLPTIDGASIWFFGDFEGMPDTIGVWYEYTRIQPNHRKWRVLNFDLIPKNQGFSRWGAIGAPKSRPVRGFIFGLDRDNDNSGTGFVTLTLENHTDTLWVDAAKNTVCYIERAARLDFALKDSLSRMDIFSTDPQSYSVLTDEAIWLLEYYDHGDRVTLAGTPGGIGTNTLYTTQFTAFGFAPNFIHPQ
jgi:hypothetical protein